MIDTMQFGKTGHQSTRLLFGAAAFYNLTDQDTAMRTMDLVCEAGINHIDTAFSYGESQARLGPWLKHNRKKVFLATKSDKRTYTEAKEELHRSLDLLNTDAVDLWQMHCIMEENDWNTAMDEETGALRAFIQAREEGLVRFIGVTSHGMIAPAIHLKSIERFPFDSVLLPYNYPVMQDDDYSGRFEALIRDCEERKIAVQLIKTICRGPWDERADRAYDTWYDPLYRQEDISVAVGWAMKRKSAFINSAADTRLLPLMIKAAQSGHEEVTDEEMSAAASRIGMTNLFG